MSKLWSNEEKNKSEALNERQDKKIDKLLNEDLQEDTKKELSNVLDADREFRISYFLQKEQMKKLTEEDISQLLDESED